MHIREVSSTSWDEFCRRINGQQRGALVNIETIASDGYRMTTASDAIFESLALDARGACNDVLSVRVSKDRELIHDIIEPIHIKLTESSASGDYNPVQIEAENGITLLTFHPAIHNQLLDGLALS
ncbi:MAG: hypothetical protein JWR19_591 [Pedosphaera sp.]|nr:hypothetical protein [Pedosphaera sp.]